MDYILHIIFLIIMFLLILFTFQNSHKEYFYSKTYELPSLFEKGFTKIDDLKDYTKEIESEYNEEIPDLCKGKKLPVGWSCFKKDVDFTTDWKNDDKNKRFYLKHNYTQEESMPFKTESELKEEIIPNLPGSHPLVKHTFNLDSLYKLEHNPRRFIRISKESAKKRSNQQDGNKSPFEIRTQYVYDTKQKKIISNKCSDEIKEKIGINECRNAIDQKNWNDRTTKISWLRKSFPGDYDKDRVINNITKVHSDSDYNTYISNKLNHLDRNKKPIKYHLKLP